jgi:hypothetical protein
MGTSYMRPVKYNFKNFLLQLNQTVKDVGVSQTYLSYLFDSFVFGGSLA